MKLVIDEKEIDNFIISENDLWDDDFAQTAADAAQLISDALDNACNNHPEMVRPNLQGLVTHLLNEYANHRQQAEWGDIEGVHAMLTERYKAIAYGIMTIAQWRYKNITLRLNLSDDFLNFHAQEFDAVTLPSGKIRFIAKGENHDVRAIDMKAQKILCDSLSLFMEKDKIETLIRLLPTIDISLLKKFFVESKIDYLPKTRFFELCTNVVPFRKKERGWSYDNFRKP